MELDIIDPSNFCPSLINPVGPKKSMGFFYSRSVKALSSVSPSSIQPGQTSLFLCFIEHSAQNRQPHAEQV